MKKYLLELIVFISGAALMVFELVGSRMFAPFLGTSLVVWTSLIGVIMGSLSLGYFLGGKLSDRQPSYRSLSFILIAIVLMVGFTALIQYFVLFFSQKQFGDLRVGSFFAAFILFAPASVLFGMVSPYAIRLKLKDLEHSGEEVGSMYAISTIGSIVGTFAGGFVLIPLFGTMKILLIIIISMFILSLYSLWVSGTFKKKDFFLMTFLSSFLFVNSAFCAVGLSNIVDIDTQYNRVFIFDTIDKKTQRPIRAYTTDPHGSHSAVFLDNDNDLVFDYLKFYRLSEYFNPSLKKSLMIGGGAFTYPRDYLRRNPEASMDVVEIDGELEDVAKEYFNLKEDSRVKVINEDGRVFLNHNQNIYDCIFIDAFNSQFSIPFQLTTVEAVEKIYNSLSDNGIVLANIISSIDGDGGRFLRAEIKTYKEFFPQVYIFPIHNLEDSQKIQNILLVAMKSNEVPSFSSDNNEFSEYLSHIWKKNISEDLPVLTDDYAPVDFYAMSIFND